MVSMPADRWSTNPSAQAIRADPRTLSSPHLPAMGDALADAPVEERRLPRDVGDLSAQALLRAGADVPPVHDRVTAS